MHFIYTYTQHGRGDEEEEEYDFEYSDEEEEETDVDLENSYYAAKALKLEDPRAAVEAFREVSMLAQLGQDHLQIMCRSSTDHDLDPSRQIDHLPILI